MLVCLCSGLHHPVFNIVQWEFPIFLLPAASCLSVAAPTKQKQVMWQPSHSGADTRSMCIHRPSQGSFLCCYIAVNNYVNDAWDPHGRHHNV